ncbi:methylmalonyl-CoA mutase family protein [Corynebacterium mendelii]|uniref:Methylmalonyl-CoA mutase n=1 Tax=Corynebacterium mendelii TaxID=2765362 RepID=A0A939DYB1_9CORY|nr:methylmalonyl-CoA mutase family protein [Corynebacterium mendelii]MBN9643479.1 methylmalonyl-CoA mutase [Corynebacterium mendelii]
MTQTADAPAVALPEDFDARYQNWYKAVAGVFARVRRTDVAEIPLDVWKKLIKTTYDGIDVRPLYTRADDLDELAAPGVFPFVRGHEVKDADAAGWGVTETFGGLGCDNATESNKNMLQALMNGTTCAVIDTTGVLGAADIPALLDKVLLEYVPVRLKAGPGLAESAASLLSVIDAQGCGDRCTVDFGATPLTSLVDGSATVTTDQAVQLAEQAAARGGDIRAIMVDGAAFSNQGGSDSQEIAYTLAAGVDYIRLLTDAGLTPKQAIDQLSVRLTASDDQFNQIAKFRAFRGLWARICEVIGEPAAAGSTPQHAVTAPVMFSQRDPFVNMLRCTVAAFAAGVGGATDVEILPFDTAVCGGLPNTSRSFAHRIARNTNLLLLEESHLGFVVDPGGGSYYIEELTDELAKVSWKIFQEVEAAGGYRAAVASGMIGKALDDNHEKVRDDIAHRIKKVTGINEFPNLLEKPLPKDKRREPEGIRRFAAQFEGLRNRSDDFFDEHGERPQAVLIPLGPLAKHNVRTGFATNLLASGGIEAINPGQLTPGTEEFAAAAKTSPIAVICGADPEYANSGQDAVKALRDAGVKTVLVAGAKKSFADADDDHSPDDYLNMTIDAAATLDELLSELGA